ncbi:MAG: sigma-70 family RNA polymerase sigma factor [Clostridia bacterium]|nr:sigma-70 family RNA polymerase sigma factor [Clostridia bacterium]
MMLLIGAAAALNCVFLLLYLSTPSSFPKPLPPEEEARCVTLAREGDREARATLIEHNLRLVAHIVKKYYTAGDQDDLISIGTIGLIKAIDSFDPDKGIRLATYAARCIENAILSPERLSAKTSFAETAPGEREMGREKRPASLIFLMCDDSRFFLQWFIRCPDWICL